MTVYLRISDDKGETLDLVDYEDIRVPLEMYKDDFPTKVSATKYQEYKKGDVMICAYPKTGLHWMSNLAHFIVNYQSIDTITSIQPVFVDINTLPTPRVMATHFKYDRLPINYLEDGGKIICVVRNPKDVAVSFFHIIQKLEGLRYDSKISWNAFVTCFLNGLVPLGSYFDYLDDWQTVIQEHADQILVVYYEDLKKKGFSEVKRIQAHLGYNIDDDRLKQVIDKCSLSNLKADVETGKVKTPLKNSKGESILYRKGEIGDWKNHLTVAQNERFDKIIEKRLKNSMFKFQYE